MERQQQQRQELRAEEIAKYAHSPVHSAVAGRDYLALRRILSTLPRLPKAGEVTTEEESILAEQRADIVSGCIDRRDVPGRETALHVAVRLGDCTAVEMLMAAGADWSLQNEQGWNALQEAVCAREDAIAMTITRYYQPLAWAKWCRRVPRIIATTGRMRDFYMEITFHFESSVIPFIGRIAPSDTYRIWKRGSTLRADMTLAGFDGFRIQRSDQSFLFLGEGTDDPRLPSGSLIVLTHKEKEISNALEGAGTPPSDAEVAQEVALMAQTNLYRPGIDVTQAELVPHLNWRRQDRTEMVGSWKAKIYDMLHVMLSVKSRRVPGAMTDEELFAAENDRFADEPGCYEEILTKEEKEQLDQALSMENSEAIEDEGAAFFGPVDQDGCHQNGRLSASAGDPDASESSEASEANCDKDNRRGWFGWSKKMLKTDGLKGTASNSQINKPDKQLEKSPPECNGNGTLVNEDSSRILKKFSKLAPESSQKSVDHQPSDFQKDDAVGSGKGKEKASKSINKKDSSKKKRSSGTNDTKQESEYKKGLRPVLWLTPDFPLKIEEFLPLLDILANKVKAVRRLRELLTTKLPPGTFPVKISANFTISVILYLVSAHPDVESKLLREIDEFGPPDWNPTAEDLDIKFPYLTQVIKEAMRFYTVSPLVAREASEPVQIGGYMLPKGTWVWMALNALAKDPRYFPEPEMFNPERFDPECEEEKNRHPYANNPFGIGPRACIGMKFAFQEIKVVLIHLYQLYTFDHSPAMENSLEFQFGIVVSVKYGIKFRLRHRRAQSPV